MVEQDSSNAEARLRAVTVGSPVPLNGEIMLSPYDHEWPTMYEQLARRIRDVLGPKALRVEHVGSTSVSGLSAKPVIDIVLVVPNSNDEDSYLPPLESTGFVLRIREPDWFAHRMLKAPVADGNVHVFSDGCEEIDRTLMFRDWLRNNAEDRELYERTKRALAARTWKYVQDYADAKSDVIKAILARATCEGRP
jgi:GrpB-like predicted nucleotidyltransferase (UPF0157 family)